MSNSIKNEDLEINNKNKIEELEISVINDEKINNESNNDTNIQYGPVLSEENSTDLIINKEKDSISSLNTMENRIEYVSQSSEPDTIEKDNILVYGNDIKYKTPYRIGKSYSFFYIKEYPLIILGPKCKKNYLIF